MGKLLQFESWVKATAKKSRRLCRQSDTLVTRSRELIKRTKELRADAHASHQRHLKIRAKYRAEVKWAA